MLNKMLTPLRPLAPVSVDLAKLRPTDPTACPTWYDSLAANSREFEGLARKNGWTELADEFKAQGERALALKERFS